ncbi:MAG TPA: serine hydrolase [Gemmata sp.]|nr:serine hydrolase [Gemmata sp.]
MRLLLVIATTLLPQALRAAEPDPAAARRLAADALKAWDVPGVAVVVVRGDDTLLLEGFGVREAGGDAKVTPDTLFPLASCTKAFTTTLLAMLADDGVIGWDDPVRKHLPAFKLSDPHADALLTVRDLLCHRTGIAGHDLLWYHAPWDMDEVIRRAQSLPLEYPFRGGFRYSSIPFLVAGRAVEKRTGEAWEKLVRERICEPLGMKGVALSSKEIPTGAERAAGHRLDGAGKVGPMRMWELREPNPSGSVFATGRDAAAWLKFHLADGRGPDGGRLVSIKNLEETKTPHNVVRREGSAKVMNPDTVQMGYALGWLVYDHRGKKVVSHGGMYDGFRVQVTMLPDEKLGIAVLCNLHDTRLTAALTNSLIDLYAGLPAKDWNAYYRKVADDDAAAGKAATAKLDAARDPAKKPTLAPAAYAGEYAHPAYGTATVRAEQGKLVLKWSSFVCPLEHFTGDAFRVAGGFFKDRIVPFGIRDGKVTGLTFAEQQFERK